MQTLAKLPMTRPRASAARGHSAPDASASAPVSVMRHGYGPWATARCCRRSAGQSSTSRRLDSRGGAEPAMYHRAGMTRAGRSEGAPRRAARAAPPSSWSPLAATVSLVFLAFMLAATDGHFVPQVVDLYLVCQYARAIAEGHPFRYNPGEPPSTGATSLLYTFGLALAARRRHPRRGTHRVRDRDRRGLLRGVGAARARGRPRASAATARRDAGRGSWSPSAARSCGPSSTDRTSRSSCCSPCGCFERWLASADVGRRPALDGARRAARPRAAGGTADRVAPGRGLDGRLRPRGAAPPRPRGRGCPVAAGLAVLVLVPRRSPAPGSARRSRTSRSSRATASTRAWPSPPNTASTWCAACCSASIPSQAPIGFSRGWASLFFPPLALAPRRW